MISRFAFLAVLLLVLVSPLSAQELTIASSYSPPYSTDDGTGILDRIIAAACDRIDLHIEVVRMPAERALADANSGVVDGVIARVLHMNRLYPQLVWVPSATIPARDFVAFSRAGVPDIVGWEGLAGFNVAFVRGWKIVERNVVGAESSVAVDSTRRAFDLLARRRTEVVVNARLDGSVMARELGIEDVRIHEPPLASVRLYPYLHERHAGLADDLAAALDELKADGTFDRIYAEGMSEPDES